MIKIKRGITKFQIADDKVNVCWLYNKEMIKKSFKLAIYGAFCLPKRNTIIVIGDHTEFNGRNLLIFNAKGDLVASPPMPELSKPVKGVYDMWFKEGKEQQIVILLTDHFEPYDTRCFFDLNSLKFSDFQRTK